MALKFYLFRRMFCAWAGLVVVWQEFAGLGGDVGFFKNEVEAQANLPLWTTTDQESGETFSDIVLQVITPFTSFTQVEDSDIVEMVEQVLG